jgi:hypothetical protein
MKLYDNKREVTLKEALTILFTNNRPNQNIEYMISFDEVTRVVAFGKSWTKKDTSNWGKNVCKYWIHEEHCPVIGYDDADLFLLDLTHISGMQKYFNQKKFHICEEI